MQITSVEIKLGRDLLDVLESVPLHNEAVTTAARLNGIVIGSQLAVEVGHNVVIAAGDLQADSKLHIAPRVLFRIPQPPRNHKRRIADSIRKLERARVVRMSARRQNRYVSCHAEAGRHLIRQADVLQIDLVLLPACPVEFE